MKKKKGENSKEGKRKEKKRENSKERKKKGKEKKDIRVDNLLAAR